MTQVVKNQKKEQEQRPKTRKLEIKLILYLRWFFCYNTSGSKETKDQIPQIETLKYCFDKLQLKDKLVSDGSSIVRTLEDMSVSKCGCR